MKRLPRVASLVWLGAVAALPLSVASNSLPGYASQPSKPYAGQSITIAVAIASPPSSTLDQFTRATGIKVHWVDIGWDTLQTKITVAMTAHVYFADIADVDWSRVGAFYALKWFAPLDKYFPTNSLNKDVPQLKAFIVNGQLVGIPMDASYTVTTVNIRDFQRAGIKTMPKTFAQYTADLKKLQKHGMPHPLDIPFAAAEGLSTYWYQLTAAFGGYVLDSSFKPQFVGPSSAGYKAMQWMVNAYKSGLVPNQNINSTDSDGQTGEMARNRVATIFSDYSGNVASIYNDRKTSTVVGQVQYFATPGLRGPGPNLGNPDGIGIPMTAQHVGAAVEFMKWIDSPANQARWASGGISGFTLPSRLSSMRTLLKSNKQAGASELKYLQYLLQHKSRPVFPNGPPPWYAQFSAAVNTHIHAAALGSETVPQAVKQIVDTVTRLHG
jgi:multiple sugar transport system substrate-binding protein